MADGLPSVAGTVRQLHDKGETVRSFRVQWLKLLGIEPPERKTLQLYTPAMLCQLLNVSVHEIRRWERVGLIKPVKKVFRLPYFDFEEVASARRLCHLVSTGVKADQIAASLERLHSLLPNVVRPVDQLEVLARGTNGVVFRDESGLIETTGQRLFDFDPPSPQTDDDEGPSTIPIRPAPSIDSENDQHRTADEWFHEGCRLLECNDIDSAVEALRLAVMNDPLNPQYHFSLADGLYRQRKPVQRSALPCRG